MHSNVWCDKYLYIIRINKSHAEICHFMVNCVTVVSYCITLISVAINNILFVISGYVYMLMACNTCFNILFSDVIFNVNALLCKLMYHKRLQGLSFVDKCAMITSCTYINFICKFIVRQKLCFFLSNAHCRLLGIYTILCKNFCRHVQHTKIIEVFVEYGMFGDLCNNTRQSWVNS